MHFIYVRERNSLDCENRCQEDNSLWRFTYVFSPDCFSSLPPHFVCGYIACCVELFFFYMVVIRCVKRLFSQSWVTDYFIWDTNTDVDQDILYLHINSKKHLPLKHQYDCGFFFLTLSPFVFRFYVISIATNSQEMWNIIFGTLNMKSKANY